MSPGHVHDWTKVGTCSHSIRDGRSRERRVVVDSLACRGCRRYGCRILGFSPPWSRGKTPFSSLPEPDCPAWRGEIWTPTPSGEIEYRLPAPGDIR